MRSLLRDATREGASLLSYKHVGDHIHTKRYMQHRSSSRAAVVVFLHMQSTELSVGAGNPAVSGHVSYGQEFLALLRAR